MLADFSCEAAAVRGASPPLVQKIQTLLARNGWETAKGSQARDIFHRMADQLPEDDLPSFVRNTRIQMLRKSPHSELTIGYFEDSGVGRIRVRIRAENNAVIAELGKGTATQLLHLRQLRLDDLLLFEARSEHSLLEGGEVEQEPYRFWSRDNLGVAVPLVFSAIVLAAATIVAWRAYSTGNELNVLGDPIWAWYGRLFAPLLMAIVTTTSVVVRDARRAPERATAEWDLASSE
ncbi:hypothetical protein [Conexibacter woesei]|uniref:hypothetical protein n=1 Tax=Conexibacter woesei TaxID=191495 RepID=UPI0002FE0CAD|nr:hypothetical protein [Conexibacter woesei]